MLVDVGDWVHRPMYFVGEYEPATTRLFRRLATPGWTVLDVGANVGYFSVVAARDGGAGSRVVAFEPNPAIWKLLAGTARLNPELDIRAENLAVGDAVGDLPLHISSVSRNSGLSSLRNDLPDTAGGTLKVKVTTVDAYCEEYQLVPDLIKIDVEGFEHQVILGAQQTLDRCRPAAVICEVAPDRGDPASIISLLSRHRYEPRFITDGGDLAPLQSAPADVGFYNVCFVAR